MNSLATQDIWRGRDHAVEKREQAREKIRMTRRMISLISGSSIPMTRKSLEEIRKKLWVSYDRLMGMSSSHPDIYGEIVLRKQYNTLFAEGISLLKRLYEEKNQLRNSLSVHLDEYTLWDKALFKAQCGVNENFLLM